METGDRVLDLLKRHSRHTTSFQILEPGYDYWFDGDDACVELRHPVRKNLEAATLHHVPSFVVGERLRCD